RQPFMQLLGARIAALVPGFCEIVVDYRRDLTQQHGFIHGGVLASIADSAAGYAAFSLMPAEATVLTVEYKLNILRPGEGEAMIARGRVLKPGRTLFVVQADVFALRGAKEEQVLASLQTLIDRLNASPSSSPTSHRRRLWERIARRLAGGSR
ncbi:MAG: PaaI family thioesterase, partial [Armatimonadota bacterium]|nr:PaaI family thioesterase [Armatimonadota bacterium]